MDSCCVSQHTMKIILSFTEPIVLMNRCVYREMFLCLDTCGVSGPESVPLHRGVGPECHEHGVGRGDDGVGHLAAAEPAQQRRLGGLAVVQRHVVVGALLVGLQLERVEDLQRQVLT